MPMVTVVGAGVIGMAIASALSKNYDVTIIARDLPGDELTGAWSSPWAGALFLGLEDATLREQKMQRDSFAYLWKLAVTHPESSVRRIEMHDFRDETPLEKIWYRDLMPEFRVMAPEELPKGTKLGMSYQSVVVTPATFLPWLRKRLENAGVTFKRLRIRALSDLKGLGHDVLVNATGAGPLHLTDIQDQKVQPVRGQTVVVKTNYDKIMIRHGKDFTYCIPRLDGTAVLGGIKQYGNTDVQVDPDLRLDILRRVHENLPDVFPSSSATAFDIVRDNVGIRPARETGLRLEKEVIDGQRVVHAYGVGGDGYALSFGFARATQQLIDDYVYAPPLAKL